MSYSQVHDALIKNEKGIEKNEGLFIFNASDFAQKNLYYIQLAGKYTCVKPYRVKRNYLDSFLLFYITYGTMFYTYRKKEFKAQSGDLVLLDSKYETEYWVEDTTNFFWFHVKGISMQAYCDQIFEMGRTCFQPKNVINNLILEVYRLLQNGTGNEHRISYMLHHIIGEMAEYSEDRNVHPSIKLVKEYIDNHFVEKLTIEELSSMTSYSRYHFSRLFRRETGFPPHEYILIKRLKHSMYLLAEGNVSVEDIGNICGFNSTAHFIRIFKEKNGITPSKFRRII